MSFQPLGDRILIKADPPQEKVGSLFLPPAVAERRRRENGCTGIVRFVGPGMLMKDGGRWPMPDMRIGDRVIYLDQPWPKTNVGGEELLVLRDTGVLAVVENDR